MTTTWDHPSPPVGGPDDADVAPSARAPRADAALLEAAPAAAVIPAPAGLPGVRPLDPADAWRLRAARLALSAERAVAVFPEVVDVRFRVEGTPGEAVLSVECTLRDGQDNDAVIETVTVKVVRDLEELLGRPFVRRRTTVRVHKDPGFDGVGVIPGL